MKASSAGHRPDLIEVMLISPNAWPSLRQLPGIKVVGQYEKVTQAIDALKQLEVLLPVLLYRTDSQDPRSVASMKALKQQVPGVKILVFAPGPTAPWVRQLLEAGVEGIVSRERKEDMSLALLSVAAGQTYFSREVMELLWTDSPETDVEKG